MRPKGQQRGIQIILRSDSIQFFNDLLMSVVNSIEHAD